eukprot:COSAG01_NODE_8345_length_2821_cov_11.207568_4_plen_63_part_00
MVAAGGRQAFASGVSKNLGRGFVDAAQLRQAKALKNTVFREQSRNTKMLSTLVRRPPPHYAA